MPRFSQSVQVVLKQTMRPRTPGCFFTDQDISVITSRTGLDASAVIHWDENMRWRYKDSAAGVLEAYLKATEGNQILTCPFA